MKKEYKSFEIKSLDLNKETNEMFIEGYAGVFGNEDTKQPMITDKKDIVMVSDILEVGSATKTINERVERIAFCLNHNLNNPVGKIVELKEDDYGLFCRVRISDSEPELKTKIKEGIYNEFSFGFQTIRKEIEKKSDGSYVRRLKEIKLYEVSIVTIARNEMAKITDIKSISDISTMWDDIISKEKDETQKYNLLQLKSLMESTPLEIEVPTENKPSITRDEFKNLIKSNLTN